MAVLLESWGVIARRPVVERTLPGGVAGWMALAPNRMACADANLCLAVFMVHEDAAAFLLTLDGAGIVGERDGIYRDAALVGPPSGPWRHQCSWLRIGRHAGVTAAWLEGSDPDPLVVPLRWQPNRVVNLSAADAARRLKFVRREGDVEVYVDTETGEAMYRGRTTPPDPLAPDLERRFQAVAEDLKPLLTFNGRPKELGFFERRRLASGIRELESLTASGDFWRVWWFLGMARRAASDAQGAFDAFEHAYSLNPAQDAIGREFAGQCLALGRGDRAVVVCERNCSLKPDDASLRANLALACVVAGDMMRAKAEVTRALAMDPGDKVTRALGTMIDEVLAGKRPRMTKYP
jgi:hypothetical protein